MNLDFIFGFESESVHHYARPYQVPLISMLLMEPSEPWEVTSLLASVVSQYKVCRLDQENHVHMRTALEL